MKITTVGRKVTLRDHFKSLAEKKLSRFDKIFDSEATANVVVTLEKNEQTVEITIRDRGMIYRAESSASEMNAALDDVIDALGRQIRKNKTRLEKSKNMDLSTASMLFAGEEPVTEDEEEDAFEVVRTKKFYVNPMSVEEAILQMNLLEHTFFLFRDDRSGKLCVVYTRKDGGYGLLEPEDV